MSTFSIFSSNRTAKRLLLFFSLVSIVFILNFPSRNLSRRIVSLLRSQAYEAGVILDIEQLQFSTINSIEFKNAQALIPTQSFPVPVSINSGTFSLAPLDLLMLTSTLDSQLYAYDGSLVSTISSGLFDKSASFNLSLKDFALNKHPFFSGLSIAGKLSAIFKGTLTKGIGNLSALGDTVLSIDLDKFNYSGGHKIAALIEVPQLTDCSLALTLNKSRETIWLKKFDLLTNLGDAGGRGKMIVDSSGMLRNIQANFEITLTDIGQSKIGGYLALAAQQSPSNPGKLWNIKIEGKNFSHLQASVLAK